MTFFPEFFSSEIHQIPGKAVAVECVSSEGISEAVRMTPPTYTQAEILEASRNTVSLPAVCETTVSSVSFVKYSWPRNIEPRFRALIRKSALGMISREDDQELSVLLAVRRVQRQVRSFEQILWEDEQNRLLRKLLEALREYVEFQEEPPGH